MHSAQPLLVTDDELLVDSVLASAAAAGADPVVVPHAADARRLWSTSPAVLVGLDQARSLTEQLLPRRPGVVLLGHESERAQLCAWSQPLGATTLALPEGVEWLSSVFAGQRGDLADRGSVLTVVGGSGGLGVSTLVVGLAQRLAARCSVFAVDADEAGGGLDIALGIEGEPGWRWDRLAASSGYLPDFAAELPRRDGVAVLAGSREGPGPPPAAMSAVLRSAARSHDVVLVDAGRGSGDGAAEALLHASTVWLVAGCDVWSVAAARRARHALTESAGLAVVTRARPWSALTGREVAELLDAPLVGGFADDRRLAAGIEQGLGPSASAGRGWLRAVDRLASLAGPTGGASERTQRNGRPARSRAVGR